MDTAEDDFVSFLEQNVGPETTQDSPAEPVAVNPEPASPQPEPAQTSNDMVPSWRLREVAEQRRDLERQIRELQAADAKRKEAETDKAKPVFWDDPEKAVSTDIQNAIAPLQQQMRQAVQDMSRRWAEQQHSPEKVRNAWQAAMEAAQRGDPTAVALNMQVMNSSDPYGDLMEWHRRQSAFNETGGDLDAYRKRVLDEGLKDPEFLQKAIEAARSQAQPGRIELPKKPNVTSLPSLNRATGSAGDDDGSQDLDDILEGPFKSRA